MSSERRERVFLVRMWQQPESPARAGWRGSVADVTAGQKRYVASPQEIADFVALRLSASDDVEAGSGDG